jgi:hypothetical protein
VKVFSPLALLLGLLMSGPGLWQAFQDPDTELAPAVFRFVIASMVAGIGITIIGGLVAAYAEGNKARGATVLDATSDDSGTNARLPVALPTDDADGQGNFVIS